MTSKAIDQYGAKKEIATKDQLKKSKKFLEPIHISIGESMREIEQELKQLDDLRATVKRLNTAMNHVAENALKATTRANFYKMRVENLDFQISCPYLNKMISFYDCQRNAPNLICVKGLKCEDRQRQIIEHFKLDV